MLKKIVLALVILSFVLCTVSCKKETRQVTCDGCGKLVEIDADSNMTDEWILFCKECGEPGIDIENPLEQ